MFVTVKINSNVLIGSVVCHDSNNLWRLATSSDSAPLGVINEISLDDEGVQWGRVILAGAALAKCGSVPPVYGGYLALDDQGRVLSGSNPEYGLIAPLTQGQVSPSIDDLILVYLR